MSLRISGLASGLDIDSWVKQLMNAHRQPLIKLQQQKQLLEWKRDEYRAINTKLLELRNAAFDMRLTGTFSAKSASSSSAAVSVTATAAATDGVYTLKVHELAKAASLTSSSAVGAKNLSGSSTKLSDLIPGLNSDITLTITGEKGTATVTFSPDATIEEIAAQINNQTSQTGVRVNYDSGLDHFFFASASTGSQAKISLKSDDARLLTDVFKLGGSFAGDREFSSSSEKIDENLTEQTFRITYGTETYEFTVTGDTTIGKLIDDINNSELGKAGVSVFLNEEGKLAYVTPNNETLTFSDDTGHNGVVSLLGLTNPVQDAAQTFAAGRNAKIEFNNVAGEFATNSFQISGIQIQLKEAAESPITIQVTHNANAVFDKIKSFVDKYNEIIESINKKLQENRYRDFLPLTDEQKEEMTEEQIKRWEERAKSGLLRGDRILSSVLANLRLALSGTVEGLAGGDIKHLSQIGITTGSWMEQGKLYIDETKLKQAIAENPDQVMALFTANDRVDGASPYDGIAVRIYEEVHAAIGKLTSQAGTSGSALASYSIGKQIGRLDDEMDRWTRRLDELQVRYYRQFTAMETAINRMNMQMGYLMAQFFSGE